MALYNNRQVTILGPTAFQSIPETLRVQYPEGMLENVEIAKVSVSPEEKKILVKKYPSVLDTLTIHKETHGSSLPSN